GGHADRRPRRPAGERGGAAPPARGAVTVEPGGAAAPLRGAARPLRLSHLPQLTRTLSAARRGTPSGGASSARSRCCRTEAAPGRIALVEPDGGRTQELVPFPAVAGVPEHVEAFGERAEVELARPVGRRHVEHGPRLARERAAVAVELLVGPPVAGREGKVG